MLPSKSGIIVLLKTPTKSRKFFPTLFVKQPIFSLFLNFEQTRTVATFGEHGSYTMLTNPIRALELHYPIIQFLIIVDGLEAFSLLLSIKSAMFSDFGQSSGEKKRKTINFSHQIITCKN